MDKRPSRVLNRWAILFEVSVEDLCGLIEYDEDRAEKLRLDIVHEDEIPWDVVATLPPVKEHRAEARPGPNSKCSCESGKKFKRCCGR